MSSIKDFPMDLTLLSLYTILILLAPLLAFTATGPVFPGPIQESPVIEAAIPSPPQTISDTVSSKQPAVTTTSAPRHQFAARFRRTKERHIPLSDWIAISHNSSILTIGSGPDGSTPRRRRRSRPPFRMTARIEDFGTAVRGIVASEARAKRAREKERAPSPQLCSMPVTDEELESVFFDVLGMQARRARTPHPPPPAPPAPAPGPAPREPPAPGSAPPKSILKKKGEKSRKGGIRWGANTHHEVPRFVGFADD